MKKGKVLLKGLVLLVCLLMLSVPSAMAQDFCQGDFNYDGNVDADDVTTFLTHFGRSPFFNPCPPDGPARPAKTGQTISYRTGDDGDLQKGVTWPNPRFTDNEDGTVTDNLTGLMWSKDANFFGRVVWDNAIDYCNNFGLADYTDWRLPNSNELASLLNKDYLNPAVPNTAGTGKWSEGDPFTDVQSYYYWSSNTYAGNTGEAGIVYISYGTVGNNDKTDSSYVWPVRGESPPVITTTVPPTTTTSSIP